MTIAKISTGLSTTSLTTASLEEIKNASPPDEGGPEALAKLKQIEQGPSILGMVLSNFNPALILLSLQGCAAPERFEDSDAGVPSDPDAAQPDGGDGNAGRVDSGFLPRPDAGVENGPLRLIDQGAMMSINCGVTGLINDLDDGVLSCKGETPQENNIYTWDPSNNSTSQPIIPIPLRFIPNQVEKMEGRSEFTQYAIAEQDGNKVQIFEVQGGGGVQYNLMFVPANISGLTAKGQPIHLLMPGSPQGLAHNAESVFVATANPLPDTDDFQPGSVLIFRQGRIEAPIVTTGYRPTSIAIRDDRLYVVTSGILENGNPSTESYLEIYEAHRPYAQVKAIPLGKVHAGGPGELAITADGGKAAIPAGAETDQLLYVDIENESVTTLPIPTTGPAAEVTTVLLSEDERHAFAVDGKNGLIHQVDMWNGKWVGDPVAIESNPPLHIQDGLALGGTLYLGINSVIHRFRFE